MAQLCTIDLGNESVTYTPEEISGYHIGTSRIFISKTLPDINNGVIRVFLEILVGGKIQLLVLHEKTDMSRFFIYSDPIGLRELKEHYEIRDRASYLVRDYHELLKEVMNDCPRVSGDIPGVFLESVELADLVKRYNRCIAPEETVFIKKIKKSQVICFGVNIEKWYPCHSVLLNDNTKDNPLEGADIFSTPFYTPGISMEIKLPNLKWVSFGLQVSRANYSYKIVDETVNYYDRITYDYDYQAMFIPVWMRVSADYKGFKSFIEAGPEYIMYLKNYPYETKERIAEEIVLEQETYIHFESIGHGLYLSPGFEYRFTENLGIRLAYSYRQFKVPGTTNPSEPQAPGYEHLTEKTTVHAVRLGFLF